MPNSYSNSSINSRSNSRSASAGRGGSIPQPPIYNLGIIGDSISNSVSGLFFTNPVYYAVGYGTYIRRRLNHRIQLTRNSIVGDYDFGIDGAEASWFLGSNPTAVSYLAAAKASPADTILILLGANDMVSYSGHPGATGATCAANIITIAEDLMSVGKNILLIAALPQRQSNPDSAQFLSRRLEQASILRSYAKSNAARVQFIQASSAVDSNNDGYLDTTRSIDSVHLNITGGAYLGSFIADAIASRVTGPPTIEIPPNNDPRWLTRNPYAMGTPGPGNTATNWTISPTAVVDRQLIARTDGIPGNWQELTLSGAGFTPPTSGYFVNFYTSSAGGYVTGATVASVMELELVSGTPLAIELDTLYATGDKTIDAFDNGGVSSVSEPLPSSANGLLITPPWISTGAASDIYARCKAWGNSVIRIGRMGTFRVSELPPVLAIPNCFQWLSALDINTILNESSIPVTDGGAIARWSDKSNNGNHVIQGVSGARPVYDADGWNGTKPTITFNGTQGFTNAYVNAAPAITIFMVVEITAEASGYKGLISTNGANSNQSCIFARTSASANWGTYNGSPQPFNSVITGAKKLLAIRRSSSGTVEAFVNGIADGTAPSSSGQDGHIAGVLLQQCIGKMSEIICYNRALTNDEMAIVTAYCTTEYL